MDNQAAAGLGPASEQADRPLPRGAGADAPQSEVAEGHGTLDYTEQNFNALVAANSAMESEINRLNDLLAERTARLTVELENASRILGVAENVGREVTSLRDELRRVREGLENEQIESQYFRDHSQVLERRLERMKGYTDRVIEQDQTYGDPQMVPAPPRPVGPALDDIPPAQRRVKRNRDGAMAMSDFEPALMMRARNEAPRRY